ncbi:cilia- and flagella-associated protein 91 [Lingula anatina]|uniref:Cilia- and flagella-associated protein 91 n=1 Tax=Lingula anatina TaxID=7574 RepID=A0A1S3HGZ4_LINAN|nr:cilia- and flagella-associated protein 91 [Lingula anatina]|eukprot:XP_013385345.1 cilia- and flagella-associated protein 91 [Lingula anatina]
MATRTQTIRRPPVQPERVHDYLYDNHYVLASERDHARATFKAHTNIDRVKRVPNFPTMFSELRHHPRFQMRLDVTDPVPRFISRQWRGYADQAREALIRYTTFNYDPSVKVPPQQLGNQDVSGANRYKFFRRPIIPFLQQVPPEVILATARQDPLAGAERADRPPTPLTKTTYTQTDYRDSEAQTDPYTPEYVVRPGSAPELLTLATLSHGKGLPAGLAEVEMIERARAKRAWEATLPPLSDVSQLETRRKMMDEMERKEWALREQEIEKLQEARLEVLQSLLKEREENHQQLNTKRLDKMWGKKQEEKERRVKYIRNEHIKAIRKLTEKRRTVEGKLERRDLTQEYSNPGSQTYAPKTRIGVFLDRGSEQFVVKSRYLDSYQGLLELEHSLPDFVTQPRIKAPKPKTVTKAGFVKRKYRQENQLRQVHEQLKEEKTRGEEPPKPLRFLQKIEKPIPRPPTPTVETPPEEEEERELAVIYLQQIIRGRATQNMMFEGKEKRMELIKELRSTHALQEAEQSLKKAEKQQTLAMQRQRRLHEHRESYIDESLSNMEANSIGDMLDFLGKELIRLQEERRVHAFSMLAERRRRIREAEESGRRQVEERRRREEDETFKQVVKTHQCTVDTYLENVILSSIDATADHQARQEIRQMADQINDIAYEIETSRTRLQSEEIAAELVHSFLLPEVQKQNMREKVKRQQRKYLLAAHKEIHRDSEDIIKLFPKQTPAASREPTTTSQGAAPAQKSPTPRTSQDGRPPSGKSKSRSGSRPSSRPTSAASGRKTPKKQDSKEDLGGLVVEGKSSSRPGSKDK